MDHHTRSSLTPPISKLNAIVGVGFSLGCSITAETILGPLTSASASSFTSAGRMALTFLTIYTLHRFALTSLSRYSPRLRDMLTLFVMILGTIGLAWVGRFISLAGSQYLAGFDYEVALGPYAFEFAIPYAAGALVLQSILGLQYGMFYSVALSIIMGVYTAEFLSEVPFVLSTSLMACLSLSRFRSRSAYMRAGMNISLVSLPFALCAVILQGVGDPFDLAIPISCAILGGILCSFVAAGVTPMIEAVGGYVTDMRLLEMATLDHPLLKELSIQAPGTWNHSMVMGMMVESAADAVGANAVLARVGAYFHDIGKMKKPLYFVENQGGAENRHDKLSCSMSALIIRSHVKDGIELAKSHKLPQAIIDMIPQHHGTSLIEYFYQKAKKEAEESSPDAPPVDKSLYSYPGPKPQTKEAGILLLADGIEAAARTIQEPTPDRIQGMVQKMINKVFASGQLDECDLTLQDLHVIAKSFVRVLTSIYHQRIAYAEPVEKGVPSPEAHTAKITGATAERMATERETESTKKQENPTNGKHESAVFSGDGEQLSPSSLEKDEPKNEQPEENLKRLGI